MASDAVSAEPALLDLAVERPRGDRPFAGKRRDAERFAVGPFADDRVPELVHIPMTPWWWLKVRRRFWVTVIKMAEPRNDNKDKFSAEPLTILPLMSIEDDFPLPHISRRRFNLEIESGAMSFRQKRVSPCQLPESSSNWVAMLVPLTLSQSRKWRT